MDLKKSKIGHFAQLLGILGFRDVPLAGFCPPSFSGSILDSKFNSFIILLADNFASPKSGAIAPDWPAVIAPKTSAIKTLKISSNFEAGRISS